jgi:hypothetical protein
VRWRGISRNTSDHRIRLLVDGRSSSRLSSTVPLTKELVVTSDYVDATPCNAAGKVLKKCLRAPSWEDVGAP